MFPAIYNTAGGWAAWGLSLLVLGIPPVPLLPGPRARAGFSALGVPWSLCPVSLMRPPWRLGAYSNIPPRCLVQRTAAAAPRGFRRVRCIGQPRHQRPHAQVRCAFPVSGLALVLPNPGAPCLRYDHAIRECQILRWCDRVSPELVFLCICISRCRLGLCGWLLYQPTEFTI